MNTSMLLPELYFNSIHTIAQQCNSEPINIISALFYDWFPVLPTIQSNTGEWEGPLYTSHANV